MKVSKWILISLSLLFLLAIGLFFNGNKALPNMTFTTLDGKALSLENMQGHPLIVTFWATDCESCLKEIPLWRDLYSRYHSKGLEILAASMYYDPPNHVIEFTKENALPYPVTLDIEAKLANAFGNVKMTPTTFLLNPKGEIVWTKIGLVEPSELTPLIETFLKE